MRIGPLKLKAQLFCGDNIAMGPGKADLLEAIGREGSISRAGAAMGMSYRRTWLLVDEMNRCWTDRLVETSPRGAHLTDCGRQVLALYRTIEGELDEALRHGSLTILSRLMRDMPEA